MKKEIAERVQNALQELTRLECSKDALVLMGNIVA